MIDSSVALAVGFIYGIPCDIDFRGFYALDELSGGRVCVGNCLLRFWSRMDCWNASDLLGQKLDDIRGFTRFYVTWDTIPFVQLEKFIIIPLRVGLEEKGKEEVVESSAFYLALKKLELFRVCGYYRLLVGVGKQCGKRGDWK